MKCGRTVIMRYNGFRAPKDGRDSSLANNARAGTLLVQRNDSVAGQYMLSLSNPELNTEI